MLWEWRNASECEQGKKLTGHTAGVTGIEFSPDGKYLLSASGDGTAKLWETSKWTVVRTLIGHEGAVVAIAFSPDGNLIVTGGADHTIRFWDMDVQTTIHRACALLQRDLTPEERNLYGVTDAAPTCNKGFLK